MNKGHPDNGSETVLAAPLALTLHWKQGSLESLGLAWCKGKKASAAPSALAQDMAKALARYVAGQDPAWPNLPLPWQDLPPFARECLQTLARDVGPGATLTYGELAARMGRPGAARAVGRAMAVNPWPLIVPCHRVLGAGGRLTGYSNEAGLAMKAWLLQREGAGYREERPG